MNDLSLLSRFGTCIRSRFSCVAIASLMALQAGCASKPPPAPAPPPAPKPVAKGPEYPAPPPPSEAHAFSMPSAESFIFDVNGLKVIVVQDHRIPVVNVRMLSKAGLIDEPSLAHLTAAMLAEGTSRLKGEAFRAAFADLGSTLDISATTHNMVLSTTVLAKDVKPAMVLLGDLLAKPKLDRRVFDQVKEREAGKLEERRAEPVSLAHQLFLRAAYPDGHPYGRTSPSSEEILAASIDGVKSFYNYLVRPNNSVLLLAGDISVEEARAVVAASMSKWKPIAEDQLPANPLKSYPIEAFQEHLPTDYVVHVIDAPINGVQVVVGNLSMPRWDPRWAKLSVVDRLFGSEADSRLSVALRDREHLVYYAGTLRSISQSYGTYSIRTQTNELGKALRVIMDERRRLRDEAPSQEEFVRAQRAASQGFPLSAETIEARTNLVWEQAGFGLKADYWNGYSEQLLAMTAEEVPEIAALFVHPVPVIALVGPISIIEPAVRELREFENAEIRLYQPNLELVAAEDEASQEE